MNFANLPWLLNEVYMLSKNKGRLEISKTGNKDLSTPDFLISYRKLSDNLRDESYKVINKLAGDNGIILHMCSALFSCQENARADIALKFISDLKSYDLQYRYKKMPSSNTSFTSKLFSFGRNQDDVHDVLVYISNTLWKDEGFRSKLPTQGLKYYILKPEIDAQDIVEKMYNGYILEHEYEEFSSFAVFDVSCFGNMGVFKKNISLEEIKQLLE